MGTASHSRSAVSRSQLSLSTAQPLGEIAGVYSRSPARFLAAHLHTPCDAEHLILLPNKICFAEDGVRETQLNQKGRE
jgi:hypothetical protein